MSVQIGAIEGLIKLRDEFTSPLEKVEGRLRDASGKFVKLGESIKGTETRIQSFGEKVTDLGNRMGKFGRQASDAGENLTKVLTLPILAVGGAATKLAVDFETSFAGVRKTIDATEAEFAELERGLRQMSAGKFAIPVDVNELNAVAEAAGQLGIAKDDVLAFTRTMADLGNTTNLTAQESAESIAQFQNIFGQAGKEVDRFGSTLVALGNAGASTEKLILFMGQRIAGAGVQIGLSQGEVLAFASALSSVGIEAEAGGSAISKVMIDIAIAVSKGGQELHNFAAVAGFSSAEFKRHFQEDAGQAVTLFIEGLGRMKSSSQDVLGTLEAMGISEVRMRDALLRASGAGDLLRNSLDLQARAWKENNALTDEAAKRYETTASQIQIAVNRLKDAGITLGQALLPVLRDALAVITPFIERLAEMARWFGELPKPVRVTVVILAGLAAAVGPVVFVTGQLLISWGQIVATGPAVTKALLAVKAAHLGTAGVLVGVVAGVALVDHWIRQNQQHQREYQAAIERTNELLGISRTKHLQNADALFQEAKATVQLLQTELQRQKAEIGSLNRVNPYFNENLSAGEQEDLRARREGRVQEALRKTEAALADAREAYVRLEGARADLGKPPDISPPPLPDPNPVEILTEDMEKLNSWLGELRDELMRTAAQNRQIATIWRQGGPDKAETERQVAAIRRSHALHNAYLQDVAEFGKRAADSLRSLRAADYDAAEGARIAEEAYKGLIDALEETAKLAGKALLDQISDDIRKGAERLREDARKLISGLALEKELSQEVEFQIRLSGVEEFGGQLAEIEASYLQLLRNLGEGSVEQGEQVVALIESRFAGFIERIYGYLQKLSDVQIGREIRGASDSSFEIYKRERDRIESYLSGSTERTAKQWEDGTAYLSQLSTDFWSGQLDTWTGIFDQLADRFGGFFNYLSQAARTLQQAQGTASSVSSAASGLGASAGLASALGAFGAYVVIAMAIYDAFKSHAESRQARKYELGAVVTMDDGRWNYGQMAEASERLSNEIKKVVEAIADSVGGLLTGFADLEIQIRRDGKYFKSFVEGELVGQFESMEEAVEAAILAAFADPQTQLAGVSAEFRTVLESIVNSVGATMDGLKEAIELARSARAARIGEAGTQFLDLYEQRNQEIRAAERAGLAIRDLIDVRDREARSLINATLGIDTAVSDQLRAIRSLNDGMVEAGRNAQEQLEAQIRAGQERLARLIAAYDTGPREGEGGRGGDGEGRGGSGGGSGGGGGASEFVGGGRGHLRSSFDPEIADLQAEIDRWLAELGRVPEGLSEMEIRMGIFDALFRDIEQNQQLSRKYEEERIKYARFKVELEYMSIRQQLVLMGRFEEFAAMFDDAYRAAMEAAGRAPGGRGAGGGGSSRDSVRDFIADRTWELAARSMGEFERAVAETRRQYEEQIEQAGRDNSLRAQLISLRERELALMAEERRARTTADFRQFLGLVNQFDQVRETAAALIRQIEDSPYGDARQARMIGRVMADLERQLDRLAMESGRDLLSGLIGDLETFGASETLLNEARRHMAILEHTLKMEHYRVEIEILRAQGRIAPQVLATIDEAFRFLAGIDPTALLTGAGPAANDNEPWAWRQGPGGYYLGPRGGENETETGVDGFSDALKKATELLARYRTDGLDPLRRRLIEITGDFRTIRSALGDTAEVMQAMSGAVQAALDDFLEPVRAARRNLFYGQTSSADTETQWARMQAEFADLQARFAAGDLSVVEGIDSFAQQFLALAQLVSPVGSQGFEMWESALDAFLAQVEQVDVADLGTADNPMTVDGIGDLALLSEAQLDALNRLYESNERVVAALEQQNASAAANYSAHALVA